MEASQIYILISIVVLLIIAIFIVVFKKGKRQTTITPLAGLAFGFVLAGIIFGDNRIVGYGLMGIGILLAIIDMVLKLRKFK